MPYLELWALAELVHTFAARFAGKKIIILSDCLPVVQAVNAGRSHVRAMMPLIRGITLCCLTHRVWLRVEHIQGKSNTCSDLLSRGQVEAFCLAHRGYEPLPTTVTPPKQAYKPGVATSYLAPSHRQHGDRTNQH